MDPAKKPYIFSNYQVEVKQLKTLRKQLWTSVPSDFK